MLDSYLDRRLRSRWASGPAADFDGPLLISYTEYRPFRPYELTGVLRDALRLRPYWPELGGAVGLSLYWQPLRSRSGSLSAWTSRQGLQEFIRLPEHIEIMRFWKHRGVLRAVDWESDTLDVHAAFARATEMLARGEGRHKVGDRAQAPTRAEARRMAGLGTEL